MADPGPLGVIAGESPLPRLSLERARRQGIVTVAAGIRGACDPQLGDAADHFREFGLGQLGGVIRYFRRHGVHRALMIGRVRHASVFSLVSADAAFLKLLARLRDRTTTSLLGTVADFLAGEGIEIIDSTTYLADLLVAERLYTAKRRLAPRLLADIEFGWQKAWGIAALDIGQTVCVKNRAVVAVEAMEGTDRTIARGGELARGGLTVVKVSRPGGDMRFDVPVIGPTTVEALQAAGARAFVVEAGRTLMLDQELTVRRAEKAGIVLLGKRQP